MTPALEDSIRADVTFSVLSIALNVTYVTFSTKVLVICIKEKIQFVQERISEF
jgi:hypothetical protein